MRDLDVALASCLELCEPDPDAAPLAAALEAAGIRARVMAWDDPAADFSSARVVLLRSTWNYWLAPRAFAAWIDRTALVSDLWNRAATVHWNMHKGYLLELQSAGVPTVRTLVLPRGRPASLAGAARELRTSDMVVKPAIAAASYRTLRVQSAGPGQGEAHLQSILAEGDALVQPYVPSVEGYGERAIVCIDGALTHAVRKSPRFQGESASISDAVPIAPEEAELARRTLAAIVGPLLYARVDMVRGEDGAPRISEVELCEPSLFFPQSPAALDRLVRAIRARLDASGGRT